MDSQQADVMIGFLTDIKTILGWMVAFQVVGMCSMLLLLFFSGLRVGKS